jgi:hypothetical protein
VSVLVRARATSLEAFLGGMASGTRRLRASWHRVSGYATPHFTGVTPTHLPQDYHRLGSLSLPRPPIGQTVADVVQEYQPVGHRLRLSASP